jgi:Cof subfamily protein (haloacid dehalogenase superfamily)
MPKPLIATDLDGTLLTTGSQAPHPDAIAAVHRAIAADIPVVFATGRSPIDILPIAEMVGHHWFAVCNDGSSLVDLQTKKVIRTHPMTQDLMNSIVKKLRVEYPGVKFLLDRVKVGAISNTYNIVAENGFEAPWAWALDGARFVEDITQEFETDDIVKLSVFIDTDGTNGETFNAVKKFLPEVTCVRIHSDKTFIDVCNKGISKATGVAEIADMQGIAQADVFAVGDLFNDIEMLDWAGFSFAVENAHPHVHDVADLIVPSNDNGGVAHVIQAALEHLNRP